MSHGAPLEACVAAAPEPLAIAYRPRALVVSFSAPVRAVSWAIVRGAFTEARHVAWLEVDGRELAPPVEPRRYVEDRLRRESLVDAIGLLTSRRVETYSVASVDAFGVRARCVATVGLGNALRAGDPPGPAARIGTINLLVYVDRPLSDEALLEASAIATEAKCAAVLEAGVRSRLTEQPATGTGTDCVVAASAASTVGVRSEPYAGKHTAIGAAIGRVASEAISRGVAGWIEEQALASGGGSP